MEPKHRRFIKKEDFEAWMRRIMERFDRQDKTLNRMSREQTILDGEKLLDNADLCRLLHVSKRTLQRYRSTGELPFQVVHQKTYYRESDIQAFIRMNFGKRRGRNNNNRDTNQ